MKFAIVLLTENHFGGAERRFSNLFQYFQKVAPDDSYFIISTNMNKMIGKLYQDMPIHHVITLTKPNSKFYQTRPVNENNSVKNKKASDPSFVRKLSRYFRNYLLQYYYYRQISAICYQKQIEVLLGVSSGILPLYFILRGKKRKMAIIYSNMDSWFLNISANSRQDWYLKYCTYNYAHIKADFIDFLSPFILKGVRDRGLEVSDERAKITACSFTDYSVCSTSKKNRFMIAFASRLEKDKNPILFLEAATRLANDYPDVVFHIMGQGRLSSQICAILEKKLRPNIIFHGFHPKPVELLAETSVFVSIQATNNYPSQSVLEAMACGNAIVASDVGDTRMFINESNGSLIPLCTEALVEALREYIEHPEIAYAKGNFAARYVRNEFTIQKAAKYYLNLFELANSKIKSRD